jgi:sterol 3beta-glucosyltransferase
MALGTRGDVFPLLALAKGLRTAGHHIRFATPLLFEAETRAAGLEYFPIGGDSERFFSGRAGTVLRDMVRNPRVFPRFWNNYMAAYARTHLRQTWEACRGFDTAVCVPWFQATPSLSEKLGRPCFAATVMPAFGLPTAELPNLYDPKAAGNSEGTRRTWRSSTLILSAALPQVNQWRAESLGLRPQSTLEAIRAYRRSNFLLGYSQVLLPRPLDWPASAHVTGFWFPELHAGWQPSHQLLRFLDRNPKPLMVGFSSQVARNPAAFTHKVISAVVRSGKSAILLTGWGGLRQTDLPPNLLWQNSVPYQWIVPRLGGFLHHGGCGTTAICMHSGVPHMAIPFGFDQSLWSTRIAELGLGPRPILPQSVEPALLADALVRMSEDPAFTQRALDVAERVRSEDGVGAAVQVIERALGVTASCAAS